MSSTLLLGPCQYDSVPFPNADRMIWPDDGWARPDIKPELHVAVVQAKRHKISIPSFLLAIVKD
jgi:hypothetical protein